MDSNFEIILTFLKVTAILIAAVFVVRFLAWATKMVLQDESKSNLPYEPNAAEKLFSFYGTSGSLIYSKSNTQIEYRVNGMRDAVIRVIIVCEIFAVFVMVCSLLNNK